MQFIRQASIVPLEENRYFLINGLNGAIELIDQKVTDICNKWMQTTEVQPLDEEQDIYQYLVSRAFICQPGQDTLMREELIKRIQKKMQEKAKSIHLTLLLTYNCNFRCSYCYEKNLQEKGKDFVQKTMDLSMVKGIYQYIDRNNLTIPLMTIYGGEPLLPAHKELVQAILEENRQRNVPTNIVSNGYTLSQYIDLLKGYAINQIYVTLSGLRDEHDRLRYTAAGEGTFDRIVENLYMAADANLPIIIQNIADFDQPDTSLELYNYLMEKGVLGRPNVNFIITPIIDYTSPTACFQHLFSNILQRINDMNFVPEYTQNILAQIHPLASVFYGEQKWKPQYFFCGSNFNYTCIDPWGKVYACQALVGMDEHSIGHFDGEAIIYNGNHLNWQNRNIDTIEECKNCWAGFLCGGGCSEQAIRFNGTLNSPDCSGTTTLVEHYLPYLYRRYVKPQMDSTE